MTFCFFQFRHDGLCALQTVLDICAGYKAAKSNETTRLPNNTRDTFRCTIRSAKPLLLLFYQHRVHQLKLDYFSSSR